jgi:predicted HTH domain antitoxin
LEGRCLKVKNECKTMEDLKKESYDRGMKNAAFDVAARYYRMGLISLKEAAEDTGMQLEVFAAKAAKISSY